jgi:predicted PurR-regulated permease PerM
LNPIARLEKLTAHPVLLTLTYLTAFLAIYAAWQAVFFITPISLIFVSGLLTAYIFWRKKRSRHHAAILIIILVMTLVFGGIHYAPLFSAYAT